jgi:O-antigen biosynthesis protein WbqP
MKRLLDISMALFLSIALALPLAFVAIAVWTSSRGPVLYWSDRIGKNNKVFRMPKFRTMRADTPIVATHLLENAGTFLTPVGSFLRKSSLDELPQLWNILKGDMSFVGPRPALFNQDDLISMRTERGVDQLLPGLTGWAQINGRDELDIAEKVRLDTEYMLNKCVRFDLKILVLTMFKVLRRDGVVH